MAAALNTKRGCGLGFEGAGLCKYAKIKIFVFSSLPPGGRNEAANKRNGATVKLTEEFD